MKSTFSVEQIDGPNGRFLRLFRHDGLDLLLLPDDGEGQRRIDEALQELDAHHGAWLSLPCPTLPSWGRRFDSLLEKVRHNDWTFTRDTYLSQHHTQAEISKGVPLKAVPEAYRLFGNLNEYSCVLNFLILDPEALVLVEDLVPAGGNFVELDRFIRINGDNVTRVSRISPYTWQAVMHWGTEVRSPIPRGATRHIGEESCVHVFNDHKTVIVRGNLSERLPRPRYVGTAILQADTPQSFQSMVDNLVTLPRVAA